MCPLARRCEAARAAGVGVFDALGVQVLGFNVTVSSMQMFMAVGIVHLINRGKPPVHDDQNPSLGEEYREELRLKVRVVVIQADNAVVLDIVRIGALRESARVFQQRLRSV